MTVSEVGGLITIQDSTSVIAAGPGVTSVNPHEVTVPASGIYYLNVTLLDLDDSLDGAGLTPASGLGRMVIHGGSGNDNLTGSGLDDFFVEEAGSDVIDGLSAIRGDQWSVSSDIDMVLTDTTLTIGGDIDTYTNVEAVSLSGLDGDNRIDASLATPASGITGLNLNGRGGNDTLIGGLTRDNFQDMEGSNTFIGGGGTEEDSIFFVADVNMSVDDETVTAGSSTSVHSGIERIDLWGGAGNNVIDASAVTLSSGFTFLQIMGFEGDDVLIGSPLSDTIRVSGGANTLDGGGNDDLLIISADADQTATNSQLTIGFDTGTHMNFERISLNGGAGDNVLDASGIDASGGIRYVQIEGLDGNDTLLGSQVLDEIRSRGGSNFIDGGASPSGTRDRVVFFQDLDMFASDSSVIVGTGVNTLTNVEQLTLVGISSDNVLDASGLTIASGIELVSLVGIAGNDTLRPSADPSVINSIDGGSGNDTLDLSHYPTPPTVTVIGTGTEDGTQGTVDMNWSFNNIELIIDPPEYDFTAETYAVSEGDLASTSTIVQVTRSVNTSIASTVNVVLSSGTAVAGDDFTPGPVPLNFLPGQVTIAVPIELLGDSDVELDETIVLSLADGIPGAARPVATLTILNDDVSNLPPEVLSASTDATFDNKRLPGDSVTVLASFSDPNPLDTHTATIDWGDGTSSVGAILSAAGEITGQHAYTTGGLFNVTVTVNDGLASAVAGTTAVVSGIRLTDEGVLQIIGSDAADQVHVRQHGNNIRVRWKDGAGPPQQFLFPASRVASVLIYTCDGPDQIQLHHNLTFPSVIDAGAGNDRISGGSGHDLIRGGDGFDLISGGAGHDILLGGAGGDLLSGGSGRDILIGGSGFDLLLGQQGQDILIGGASIHDNDNVALNAIRTEWSSSKAFHIRRQNLIDGSAGGALNGSAFLGQTSLIDDNDFDLLFGGWGLDWSPE